MQVSREIKFTVIKVLTNLIKSGGIPSYRRATYHKKIRVRFNLVDKQFSVFDTSEGRVDTKDVYLVRVRASLQV